MLFQWLSRTGWWVHVKGYHWLTGTGGLTGGYVKRYQWWSTLGSHRNYMYDMQCNLSIPMVLDGALIQGQFNTAGLGDFLCVRVCFDKGRSPIPVSLTSYCILVIPRDQQLCRSECTVSSVRITITCILHDATKQGLGAGLSRGNIYKILWGTR